ncbi:hypothetical protein KDK_13110 [Dictyobacter kobayashii]|uniref:Uncharacterized protein n=1 Tax=Dictyobacter kobayashii TaxID=2014872 RepID=A0A402AEJ2_9CHLR|nr:hypothetical protein KDK_13110 [Dictyobacter kobayashii]
MFWRFFILKGVEYRSYIFHRKTMYLILFIYFQPWLRFRRNGDDGVGGAHNYHGDGSSARN